MRERHPDEIADDPIEVGDLPLDVEADFIEAMSPGDDPSEALRAHLRAHPRDAEDLDQYRALAARIDASAEALDPGPHFFDALFEDVMASLPPQEAAPHLPLASRLDDARGALTAAHPQAVDVATVGVQERRGRALEGRRGEPEVASGWLEGLLSIIKARPTLAWGAVMLGALLAVALWPSDEAPRPAPEGAEVAAVGDDAPPDALQTSLSAQEIGELRLLASQMVLDMEDDRDEIEEPEDDSWRTEPIGALRALDEDELAALDAALVKL